MYHRYRSDDHSFRFTGIVKLKSILLDCFGDSSAPSEMRAFINMPDIDFSSAESRAPTQNWILVSPTSLTKDPVEYPTKYTIVFRFLFSYFIRAFKFANVSHLSLFFPSNYGSKSSKLKYIGLMGEFILNKVNPVITKYELVPNPADHKSETEMMSSAINRQGF